MNTPPKLLTVDELKDLDKRWSVVLHEKDWTKQKDLLSLIGFSGNIGDIIDTALAAMRELDSIRSIKCECYEDVGPVHCTCGSDAKDIAREFFQQTGEDKGGRGDDRTKTM